MVFYGHGKGQILTILKLKIHNQILRAKISLSTNFQVVIQISQ